MSRLCFVKASLLVEDTHDLAGDPCSVKTRRSGADNMALYFPPAAMPLGACIVEKSRVWSCARTVLFCEVPPGEVDEPG